MSKKIFQLIWRLLICRLISHNWFFVLCFFQLNLSIMRSSDYNMWGVVDLQLLRIRGVELFGLYVHLYVLLLIVWVTCSVFLSHITRSVVWDFLLSLLITFRRICHDILLMLIISVVCILLHLEALSNRFTNYVCNVERCSLAPATRFLLKYILRMNVTLRTRIWTKKV